MPVMYVDSENEGKQWLDDVVLSHLKRNHVRARGDNHGYAGAHAQESYAKSLAPLQQSFAPP